MKRIDALVADVVRPMFESASLISRSLVAPLRDVRSAEHQELALKIATQGAVLLKNQGLLPIVKRTRSLAVIGDDAGGHVQTTEKYGGFVNDPHFAVRTPLDAISARARETRQDRICRRHPGNGAAADGSFQRADDGKWRWRWVTATWFGSADFTGPPLFSTTDPTVDLSRPPHGLPTVWSVRWQGRLTPPRTGRYRFSLSGGGDSALYINGHRVVLTVKQDFTSVTHGVVHLNAKLPAVVRIDYSMAATISPPTLQWGWQMPDELFTQAIAAAKRADTVAVFASDRVSEGGDRTDLKLPGDQDQMIAAVAAANPRTIVVLHTVGPVLMPWLPKVAAVIESWYPGEEAAGAIAAILFGDSNPSGKLPVTFPASETQGPDSNANRFPGVRGRVHYEEGLLVGYRYYDSQQQAPLFPFGFGLSYTSFEFGELQIETAVDRFIIEGTLRNSGHRDGAEVVQLYLGYPKDAEEPPWQLKGFQRVVLAPGEQQSFRFNVSRSDLAVWDERQHKWLIPSGKFQIGVGSSSRNLVRRAYIEL